MHGEENQQLIAELSNPNRIAKSVIFDQDGFTASVSDTSASKIASYVIDPKRYPNAEIDSHDDEFSDDSDEDGGEDSRRGEGKGTSTTYNDNNNHIDMNPNSNDEEESFKYKIEEGQRELAEDEVGIYSVASGASTHTPSTASRSVSVRNIPFLNDHTDGNADDVGQSQSVAFVTEEQQTQLDTVTELSSWEAKSNVDERSMASSLNPGGEKARAMNDDTIFDAKEAMESCGAPNKRQVHSLDLRSVYESYGVAGEPLYTTSNPEDSNFRGVACMDYIFFTARPLNATKLLSIPPLGKMTCDDPRESLICADPYWFTPPKVFNTIFDKHAERGLIGKKLGKTAKLQERDIEAMVKKLEGVLREGDGKNGSQVWGGHWVPFPTSNSRKTNCWLPNEAYASSHIALCAHFQIDKDNKATEWR